MIMHEFLTRIYLKQLPLKDLKPYIYIYIHICNSPTRWSLSFKLGSSTRGIRAWGSVVFLDSAGSTHPAWGSQPQVLRLSQGLMLPSPFAFSQAPVSALGILPLFVNNYCVRFVSLSIWIWKFQQFLAWSFSTNFEGVACFDLGASRPYLAQMYALPASILNPAVMWWIVSGPLLHSLNLKPTLSV